MVVAALTAGLGPVALALTYISLGAIGGLNSTRKRLLRFGERPRGDCATRCRARARGLPGGLNSDIRSAGYFGKRRYADHKLQFFRVLLTCLTASSVEIGISSRFHINLTIAPLNLYTIVHVLLQYTQAG